MLARPTRAPAPARLAYAGRAAPPLSAWLCPEVSVRVRREQAQQRRALRIAERAAALLQAERQQELEREAEARRDRRRRADRGQPQAPRLQRRRAPTLLPASPELCRPQSLLIPELLPKEMLNPKEALGHRDAPAPPQAMPIPAPSEPAGPSALPPPLQTPAGSPPLGLGLDLGLDLDPPARTGPPDTSAAILEIAEFLERDIDVFTPTALAQTPRSAGFAVNLAPPDSAGLPPGASTKGQRQTREQQDLVDDILNMTF
ncbi:hypothetical protein H4R18_002831 [Coemansia javaensis]|uniref:Uncharacterized protein n=1 Tax=Coemansia javaensis TaxID=2761396 RepID=A0A9W8LH62_9FUNG|nr:hypothetical protein H4R18_002831 [Coemansia javaensis]